MVTFHGGIRGYSHKPGGQVDEKTDEIFPTGSLSEKKRRPG